MAKQKQQAKSFAEMQLASCRNTIQRHADDLVWQLTHGGIDNIHVYATAETMLAAYREAGAWARVVDAEPVTRRMG